MDKIIGGILTNGSCHNMLLSTILTAFYNILLFLTYLRPCTGKFILNFLHYRFVIFLIITWTAFAWFWSVSFNYSSADNFAGYFSLSITWGYWWWSFMDSFLFITARWTTSFSPKESFLLFFLLIAATATTFWFVSFMWCTSLDCLIYGNPSTALIILLAIIILDLTSFLISRWIIFWPYYN